MNKSIKNTTYVGLYTAFCVAVGYLLAAVPNIEMITLSVFFGGYLFGKRNGILIGIIAEFIYSAFNPWGSGLAFPPLLTAQVLSFGLTGLYGGIFKNLFGSISNSKFKLLAMGAAGLAVSLQYNVLLTLFTYKYAGLNFKALSISIVAAVTWASVHIASNTTLFAFLLPMMIKTAEKNHILKNIKESRS